ncbi:MAG TPA: hypothetical protein PLL50_10775 [Propionicimonas sp.]|nr:hypothetical protein [Propionicimonas sp.]HQA78825.1 hypothetical protein [Propionicimonas sp.]HQD96650.1 hypothetical protein [Propionicimonas sp.]
MVVMETLSTFDLFWTVCRVLALAGSLIVPLVFVLVGLRLTDWLGYGLLAVLSVLSVLNLVDTAMWAAAIGVPAALAIAYGIARAMARAYREHPDLEFDGFFPIGSPPARVRSVWPRKAAPRAK